MCSEQRIFPVQRKAFPHPFPEDPPFKSNLSGELRVTYLQGYLNGCHTPLKKEHVLGGPARRQAILRLPEHHFLANSLK